MARRKSLKTPAPRTVTTRSQAKQPQGAPHGIAQVAVVPIVNNQNKVAKKRNKRHSKKYKQKLMLQLALQQQLNTVDKPIDNSVNTGFGADDKDGKDFSPGYETESVRQEFHDERQVSLSQSPMGKSIQITCRNYSDISDMGVDDCGKNKAGPSTTEASTVCNEQPIKYNRLSEAAIGGNNLSLASFDTLQLKRKEQFQNDVNGVFKKDDVDAIELIEDADDDVLLISDICNDTLPSLIIIDDESRDEKLTVKTAARIDVIDLTTPQPSPARPANNPPPQISSNCVYPIQRVLTTNNRVGDFPQASTGRFSPIQQLHFPPCNRSNHMPSYAPTSGPAPFNYNLQSNIYGNNFLNMGTVKTTGLRPIFIDGSNVGLLHSNGKYLSVRGIQICIDYFKLRGHEVTAILPQIRKRQGQNSDPKLLRALEKEGSVTFTPSRLINGRHVVPYDDRFIVQLAAVHQGIVVSNDNYKDLLAENPNLKDTIENRVLNPTFVRDMIIFPSDPLGRHGPKLDEFLRFP